MHIVITGASRGIGKAIATLFAEKGHSLYLTSKTESALQKTAEELAGLYPGLVIRAKAFDLGDAAQAKAFGAWVLAQGILPDVLINNAGTFQPGNISDEPASTLESQIAANLYSAYHVTRSLLPAMMKPAAQPGLARHIFNMCSIASLDAYPNGGAYSISKFALHGFSKNLREEMKPHGIKVTAVFPGAVLTDSWGDFDNSSNRIMLPEDIAQLIYAATQLSPQACVEDIVIRPQLGDL